MMLRYISLMILSILLFCLTATAAKNPHGTLKFGCKECHTVESFTDVTFDHDKTGYHLEERHNSPNCKGCHDIKNFKSVSKQCTSCHLDVHQQKLGTDCEQCHTVNGWEKFDIQEIHFSTEFPLAGKHALLDCMSCHKGLPTGDMSFNTTRCVDCHQTDYLNVTSPNHVSAGFSTECQSCHQMERWRPALFENHDVLFPIFTGTHDKKWNDCASCHKVPNNYQEFNCLECHEHRQSEMDPRHNGITGYTYNSPDCYFCHPTGEAGDFLEHDAQFFPIFSGRHINTWDDCATCHVNPTDRQDFSCVGCHDHNQTDMDNAHGTMSGYSWESVACFQCHPTGDAGDFLDHDPQFFPIFSGKHNNTWEDCAACHTNPDNKQVFNCLTCHEHNQTDTDNSHSGITGYAYNSDDCYFCHPSGETGDFVAHDASYFPIFSGIHISTWDDCSTCHINPTNRQEFSCVGCHDHNQTDMDNMHGSMTGYSWTSSACYDCHPSGEKGDFTSHDAEFFPVFSGRHSGTWTDCTACHTNTTTRTEFSCLGCHEHNQTDMDNTHSGITGYAYNSNDCLFCHPAGEAGDFVAHDASYFPIFSGTHNSSWDDCSTCHINPNNRQEFSCVGCHDHNQTDMDNVHGTMSGYNWESNSCYSCHPSGDAGDFVDHDAQFFPIFSGTHLNQWSDCATCHTDPSTRTVYTCLPCHEHNQTLMDNMHGSMNGYSYASPACLNCHPIGDKGQFLSHDGEFFPIFSGRHQGRWDDCTICHDEVDTRNSFSCLNCHEHSQSNMDDKHLGEVNGYVYNSDACLNCHPTGRSD